MTAARAVLATAFATTMALGLAAPALADPAEFCVGISDDRQAYCVSTDWLPAASPVSPR
ncbi:MAG TPA: hypothetical protein VNB94_00575 [Mycobacteriales bacterium]|nr:hypothetical protein [Mycobacteriales bacterium]